MRSEKKNTARKAKRWKVYMTEKMRIIKLNLRIKENGVDVVFGGGGGRLMTENFPVLIRNNRETKNPLYLKQD